MSIFTASLEEIDSDTITDFSSKEDIREIDQLYSDIFKLQDSFTAIESFGISPTTVAILKVTGLLSSTAIDKVALETMTPECGDSLNSKIALEAISEEIKEKVAKWSAKILGYVKKAGDILSKIVTPIWEKIKEYAVAAKEKISDNSVVQYVKTHPYETIFMSIVAVTSIYAATSFALKAYPSITAPSSAFTKFNESLLNKLRMIKLPWGKIYTKATIDGKTIMCEVIPEVVEKTVKSGATGKLGWTKGAIDNILALGSKAFAGAFSIVKDVNSYYITGIHSLASVAKWLTGMKSVGVAVSGYMGYQYGKILALLGLICINIVRKTFTMIRKAFSDIKEAVVKVIK